MDQPSIEKIEKIVVQYCMYCSSRTSWVEEIILCALTLPIPCQSCMQLMQNASMMCSVVIFCGYFYSVLSCSVWCGWLDVLFDDSCCCWCVVESESEPEEFSAWWMEEPRSWVESSQHSQSTDNYSTVALNLRIYCSTEAVYVYYPNDPLNLTHLIKMLNKVRAWIMTE